VALARRVLGVLAIVVVVGEASCAHREPVHVTPAASAPALPAKLRLGAIMWPTSKAVIFCTRRLDDFGKPVGVAGPCYRQEVGEPSALKILSWATLGRFDPTAPDATPTALGGRCRIEIEPGHRAPNPRPATLTWVTPTRRVTLEEWNAEGLPPTIDADVFTLEASFAPEGEWLAILRVAIELGDGERVIDAAGAQIVKIPACD
jgi:hypothetical protein